jgi:hypothetical protein
VTLGIALLLTCFTFLATEGLRSIAPMHPKCSIVLN